MAKFRVRRKTRNENARALSQHAGSAAVAFD